MLYGIAAAIAALSLCALLAGLLRGVPLSRGFAVVLVTGLVAGVGDRTGVAPLGAGVGGLLAAGACVAVLGPLLDAGRLRWWVPVAGTAVAAACVVPYEETGVAGGLLAVAWIVGFTTAFRGLGRGGGPAGAVGVVTAFGLAACAAAELMDGIAVLLTVLGAALAGFLLAARPRDLPRDRPHDPPQDRSHDRPRDGAHDGPHVRPPHVRPSARPDDRPYTPPHARPAARIALGASGSLFTGFVLAAAAVFVRAGQPVVPSAGVLFALGAVVCADGVLVLLSRRLNRRPLTRGAPDHLPHRLRRLGLAPRAVTALLCIGALGGVLVAVLAHLRGAGAGGAPWVAAVALVVVVALLRVPVYGNFRPRRGSPVASSQVSARLRVRSG
ncbi:undecaprenyl/decaprenyl-phosphate alpha-N-acetylglucosaminyl 1-phosphate transferase [Streptomyces sp. NPDC005931]|uniref:undecaprenyl/decaprenyl-phosphate alpha-N-acetylglucosaminyl 1-phosphate transferase n=1 Tax=Streptomyces sp. NPDC005931 TaxID=3364737 RepID=UPI0036AFED3E